MLSQPVEEELADLTAKVQRDPAQQVQRVTFHYRWFDDEGQEHHQRELRSD